jgi:hypothetical protein
VKANYFQSLFPALSDREINITKMRTVQDIKRYLTGLFGRNFGEWLKDNEDGVGQDKWPLSIALHPPTDKETVSNTQRVKAWVDSWSKLSPDCGEVEFVTLNWRHMGRQVIPKNLQVPNPEAVAYWLNLTLPWVQAKKRYSRAISIFPELKDVFFMRRHELFDLSEDDFDRLIGVLTFFKKNPRTNLYPRELPIPGVDSKWLKAHAKSVFFYAPLILPLNLKGKSFYESLGIKPLPVQIRLRLLDQKLRDTAGGWSDLAVPLTELKKAKIKPSLAIIVENLQTGLSFKDLPGAVVFMGLGNGATVLGEIPWLKNIRSLYWGDIDTYGFRILSSMRQIFPNIQSILMDEETLFEHKSLWVREASQAGSDISHLTSSEEDLFNALKDDKWGKNIRLEQERIIWDYAWERIKREAIRRGT